MPTGSGPRASTIDHKPEEGEDRRAPLPLAVARACIASGRSVITNALSGGSGGSRGAVVRVEEGRRASGWRRALA